MDTENKDNIMSNTTNNVKFIYHANDGIHHSIMSMNDSVDKVFGMMKIIDEENEVDFTADRQRFADHISNNPGDYYIVYRSWKGTNGLQLVTKDGALTYLKNIGCTNQAIHDIHYRLSFTDNINHVAMDKKTFKKLKQMFGKLGVSHA